MGQWQSLVKAMDFLTANGVDEILISGCGKVGGEVAEDGGRACFLFRGLDFGGVVGGKSEHRTLKERQK
jgi:hypothetical protein